MNHLFKTNEENILMLFYIIHIYFIDVLKYRITCFKTDYVLL